ncbi:MAG: T9SS type A sorting domain-containing protein [Ignavibacteriales bacterium]|nr:T9SS type A sorting domain-containing protein [Ignavibacteriales bacterium]
MRIFTWLLAVSLICPFVLPAQTSSDLVIYNDDALQSPWINNSWSANLTFNSSEQVHDGVSSIKVELTSAWGALSLHYGNWGTAGIDPVPYQSFDFVVHGGMSGTLLSIFFENDAGQSFPSVNNAITANQWTTISIPMSQLNPNNQTINRISIQDISGSANTFFVDNMNFAGTSTGAPPDTPTLVSPANGTSGVTTAPQLVWNVPNGAETYRLQLSDDSSFATQVIDQSGISDTFYTTSSALQNNTTYFWKVNATNSVGTSGWSSLYQFTTASATPPSSGISRWMVQSSKIGARGDWLNAVYFTDRNTGTAVGGAWGLILRTTNGGRTWTPQQSGVSDYMESVHFLDANRGAVGMSSGGVLMTSDGGTTWVRHQVGAFNLFHWGIAYLDANTIVTVGLFGQIWRTSDGGTTWTQRRNESGGSRLYGVSFSDFNNGTAVGWYGRIVRTTDGGVTWTNQTSGTSNHLSGVSFTDANTGTIVGAGGTILRTTNGGATWTAQSSGTTAGVTGVKFLDANRGVAVGGNGLILETSDGGATWRRNQNTVNSNNLSSVSLVDENSGWAVGNGGRILSTSIGNLIMYDDALVFPWTHTSWDATITFGSAEQSYNGSANSIKVVPSREWGALRLRYGNWNSAGTIDLNNLDNLEFAVYVTVPTELYVALENDQGYSFQSFSTGPVTPNTWVSVSIPLSQMNPDSQIVHGIYFQSSAAGIFYVDEIHAVGGEQSPSASRSIAARKVDTKKIVPREFALEQNYPNPFNPTTTIGFTLQVSGMTTLKIYDAIGREVATLVNENLEAGVYHQKTFDASNLASGMYFAKLSSDKKHQLKKLMLVK